MPENSLIKVQTWCPSREINCTPYTSNMLPAGSIPAPDLALRLALLLALLAVVMLCYVTANRLLFQPLSPNGHISLPLSGSGQE